jgi:hypothetical protein
MGERSTAGARAILCLPRYLYPGSRCGMRFAGGRTLQDWSRVRPLADRLLPNTLVRSRRLSWSPPISQRVPFSRRHCARNPKMPHVTGQMASRTCTRYSVIQHFCSSSDCSIADTPRPASVHRAAAGVGRSIWFTQITGRANALLQTLHASIQTMVSRVSLWRIMWGHFGIKSPMKSGAKLRTSSLNGEQICYPRSP